METGIQLYIKLEVEDLHLISDKCKELNLKPAEFFKIAGLAFAKETKPKLEGPGLGPDISGLTYEDVFPTEDLPIALHDGTYYSELPDAKKASVDAYVSRGVSNGVPVDVIRQKLVGDVVSSGPRTLNLPNGRIVPLKRSR